VSLFRAVVPFSGLAEGCWRSSGILLWERVWGGGGGPTVKPLYPSAHLHINRVRYETVILRILNVRNMHLSECQFYVYEITSENYLVGIFRGINLHFILGICSV
jgi:hypothetical protein